MTINPSHKEHEIWLRRSCIQLSYVKYVSVQAYMPWTSFCLDERSDPKREDQPKQFLGRYDNSQYPHSWRNCFGAVAKSLAPTPFQIPWERLRLLLLAPILSPFGHWNLSCCMVCFLSSLPPNISPKRHAGFQRIKGNEHSVGSVGYLSSYCVTPFCIQSKWHHTFQAFSVALLPADNYRQYIP